MKRTRLTLALILAVAVQITACGKDEKSPAAPAPAPAPAGCNILGYNAASNNQWGAGYLSGNPYKPVGDFVVRSIAVETTATATTFRLGIYTNNGSGEPQNLLAETGAQARATAGWVTFGIGPVTLTADTRYWLMSISNTVALGTTRETGVVTKYVNLGVAAVQTPLPNAPGASTLLDGTNSIIVLDCD